MKILFLSRWLPYPANNGSKLRIYNLLCTLATFHDVTLLSFCDEEPPQVDTTHLESFCTSVHLVKWQPFNPKSKQAILGFFHRTPRSIIDTFSQTMANYITNLINSDTYNLVIASELGMIAYSRFFSSIPAIAEDVELISLRELSMLAPTYKQKIRYTFTWMKYQHYNKKMLPYFNHCTVVSEQEKQILEQVAPKFKKIEIVPNSINLNNYHNKHLTPKPNTLIFAGSFTYNVNYEGMLWFLEQVFPLILTQNPNVHLTITGDHANLPLPSVANVHRSGFVDNIQAYIAESWASIVPIWSGSGTRLKILEAMALQTPVISTMKGAEGLNAIHNTHLLIADTPEQFAHCTLKLLSDSILRKELASNAYKLVQQQYNWATVSTQFLNIVASTGTQCIQ